MADLALEIERTVDPTTTDGTTTTPHRRRNLPEVHFGGPTAHVDNLDGVNWVLWNSLQGPLLAAHIWGQGYDADNAWPNATLIAETILETTGVKASVRPPYPDRPTDNYQRYPLGNRPPHAYLIYDLSEEDYHTLRQAYVISTQKTTIMLHNFPATTTAFIAAIRDAPADHTQAYSQVKTVLDAHDLYKAIHNTVLTDRLAEHLNTEETTREIYESLTVSLIPLRSSNRGVVTIARIYLSPCGSSPHAWQELRRSIQRTLLDNETEGQHTRTNPFFCPGCHAADHPITSCPFPQTPGWNGARIGPPSSLDDQTPPA